MSHVEIRIDDLLIGERDGDCGIRSLFEEVVQGSSAMAEGNV